MKRVYTAGSLQEAYIVLHLFNEARIEATVQHENAMGAMGEIHSVYPEIWVSHARDEEKALELVRNYESALTETRPSHRCDECGEDNPGNFELCWSCQASLS